jgi:hypothetical protein
MYSVLEPFHSYLAVFVLLGLLIGLGNALSGLFGNRAFLEKDRKLALPGLIAAHLQWVLGIILYFISPLGMPSATEGFMKNSVSRLYVLEHPLIMVIAVVLITIGYSRAKRLTDHKARFRSIALFYGIGLVLVLSRIPWQNWLD